MLDLQPTLAGTHITLRPLAAQDFGQLFAAASDPLVWTQHPDPARGTREGFPAFFESALQSKACLVAMDVARRSVIGWPRYSNYTLGGRSQSGTPSSPGATGAERRMPK